MKQKTIIITTLPPQMYQCEINDRVYIIITENGQFQSVHLLRDNILYDIITEKDQWAIGKTAPGPIFLFKSDFGIKGFDANSAADKMMSGILEFNLNEELGKIIQSSDDNIKRKM